MKNSSAKKSPALVVFVPKELPKEVKERLAKTAREIFAQELVVEFRVDPDLLGGAALAWQGYYKDYSLRARFAEKSQELEKIYGR